MANSDIGRAPAFQFYAKEYLSCERVASLSLDQEGALARMLAHDWNAGGIPDDAEKLARIVGKGATATMISPVLELFREVLADGRRTHHKLAQQRIYQAKKREQNSANARQRYAPLQRSQCDGSTGGPRWRSDGSAAAVPSHLTATPTATAQNKHTQVDELLISGQAGAEHAGVSGEVWSRWVAYLRERHGRNPTQSTLDQHLRIIEPLSPTDKIRWIECAIASNLPRPSEPFTSRPPVVRPAASTRIGSTRNRGRSDAAVQQTRHKFLDT